MTKIFKDKTGSWYGTDTYLSPKQSITNARCVAKYCKNMSKHNWARKSCIAMLGNMWRESHVNPQVSYTRGDANAYGLCQWDPKGNLIGRAKAIKQYKTYDMMYTQLCVIDFEADQKGGKYAQWNLGRGKPQEYDISFKDFIENKGNHSLEWLVRCWCYCYERAGDEAMSERIEYAHLYDEKINWDKESSDDGGSIDDFLEWCKHIADDNEYRYIWGANHHAPPWTIIQKGFDCSSFISYGLHDGGGYDLSQCFTTSDMRNGLEKIGFNSMVYKRSKLKRGDIVIREGEHVEAIYSVNNGNIKIVGAHASEINGVPVPIPDQISVKDLSPTDSYEYIIRPFNEPSSKPRENPTNSNKSSRAKNPKTPTPISQNTLPPTFLKRKRRF